MPLNLDYYYGSEAEQYSFYRIPKLLFTDRRYQPVSVEAKVLYGLLLDRMALSARNGWLDSAGRVFIYFTLEDAMEQLGCGHGKAVRLFAELDSEKGIGLIERKKQGQGKPTKIYVKNFVLPPDGQTSDSGKSNPSGGGVTSDFEKSGLPEMERLHFPKSNANNTEINKTELNDTDLSIHPVQAELEPVENRRQSKRERLDAMDAYRELIKDNIDYEVLLQENPYEDETIDGYVELMLEVCCSQREFTRINKQELPTEVVKSRFLKLTKEHISYVLDSLRRNTTLVGNIKAYTLSALYNAPVTMSQYYTSLVSHDMAQGFAGG